MKILLRHSGGVSAIFVITFMALVLCSSKARAQDAPLDGAILDWDSSGQYAEFYNVYRAPQGADDSCPTYPAGFTAVGRVDAPALTYTDGPLAFGQTYCWHVTAANADEESDASGLVIKRIAYPKPLPPANLRVR